MVNLKNGRVVALVGWDEARITAAHCIAGDIDPTLLKDRQPWVTFQRLAANVVRVGPLNPGNAVVIVTWLICLPANLQATERVDDKQLDVPRWYSITHVLDKLRHGLGRCRLATLTCGLGSFH